MDEFDKKWLNEKQAAEFVEVLVNRARGENLQYPIAPVDITPEQLEVLVDRACSVTTDPDAIWSTLAQDLSDDTDRDKIVATAIEEYRPIEELHDTVRTDGGSTPGSSRDWDMIGREIAEAVVSDLTGGPIDHEQTAIFKARLQKGGRISVPEPELESLHLRPGDLLQVHLRKIDDDR